jgi:hypothetical protein
MDPDQPAHPRTLVRIHAVRLPTKLQVEKMKANSMDPDQTARMQTHYVGFVLTRLIYGKSSFNLIYFILFISYYVFISNL